MEESYVLSDGTDLTPLFEYLSSENAKLGAEMVELDEVPEDEQDEFVLQHIDLLPSEFAEQVKSLLIPALTQKCDPDPPALPPVSYQFDEPEGSSNIEYGESGEVKAVSLSKFVEIITEEAQSSLAPVLLTTYPLYTTADSLLELILNRLKVPVPRLMSATERSFFVDLRLKKTHTLITSVLKQWIKLWPDLFRLGTPLSNQLNGFFPTNREFSVETNNRILAKQLSKVQEENMFTMVFAEDRLPPLPLLPRELDFKTNPLLVWPAEEVARQLTLVDFKHLKKVSIYECLARRWETEGEAPNIARLSQRYASRRALFISALVNEAELDARVRLASKLLEIAACCLDLFHNYETPLIIKAVFISTSILSLTATLREVQKRPSVKATYNRLLSLYEACDFEAVKAEMDKHCTVPCWLALRQDLWKIDLALPDYTDSGLINLKKHSKTTKVILRLRDLQSKDFCYHKVALCYNYVKAKNFVFDERKCESRARTLEK